MSDQKNDIPLNLFVFHKLCNEIKNCLAKRDLLRDSSYTSTLVSRLGETDKKTGSFKVYIGFDPTAPSLHLGHYIQIQTLLHLQKKGFKVFALVGEATAKIGDPSGRTTSRPIITDKTVEKNASKVAKQLKHFGLRVVNNKKFYDNTSLLDFLQTIGSKMNVNLMLNKDMTQNRLATTGLTFQEFSYQALQAYDFYKMYKTHGVAFQIGGSDQWGNITAGLNLIHKMHGTRTPVAGFTTPLLVGEDGFKFGKTASGKTIWLDKNRTNAFVLYQSLRTLSDNSAYKLILWLSNKSLKEVVKIRKQHETNPTKGKLQVDLACEVVAKIHGSQTAIRVSRFTALLFNENPFHNLFKKDLEELASFIPSVRRKKISLKEFLVKTQLAASKREATEFIMGGAIHVNQKRTKDVEYELDLSTGSETYKLVRRGKNQYALMLKPQPRKKSKNARKN